MSHPDLIYHRDRGAVLLPPKPELTEEGFLRTYLRIGKVGELKYRNLDGSERIEVVTPEVLFSKDSINSFKMKPITYPHPPVKVNPRNSMQYSRGMLGHYAVVDGDFLGFVGTVTDATAIDALLSGTAREASSGYDAPIAPRGDGKFDQVQRRGNHTAIVPAGRAGYDVRFNIDAADDDCWYQVDSLDLYNADSDTVQEVFKDIACKRYWDLGDRRDQATPPTPASTDKPNCDGCDRREDCDRSDCQKSAGEQSGRTDADLVMTTIAFPSGRVFEVEDEALAAAILELIAKLNDKDEDDMETWKELGYDSADAAITGLKSKLDAAEGRLVGVEAKVTDLTTKLDAAEKTRLDADQISTEITARADAWELVEPLMRADDANFKRDNALDVNGIRKLAIAKIAPHVKLDGKSPEFVNAVWETIEPTLKQDSQHQDSSQTFRQTIEQVQRQDCNGGGMKQDSPAMRRKQRSMAPVK